MYNLTFQHEEVAITDLSNMNFTFEYVDGVEDLQNKIAKFVNNHDYELQYMGGELRGLATNYIQTCYEIAEETNTPLWVISHLFNHYYDIEEVKAIIEDEKYIIYEESNETNVIIQYVENTGILEDVPQFIANYFDYEEYKRDLELNGDITIIDTNTFNKNFKCIYILVENY